MKTTHIISGLICAMVGTGLFATFMMVFDELFSLAMYVGQLAKYPFPWSAPLDLWAAWVFTFSVIVASVALMNVGTALVVYGVMKQ